MIKVGFERIQKLSKSFKWFKYGINRFKNVRSYYLNDGQSHDWPRIIELGTDPIKSIDYVVGS